MLAIPVRDILAENRGQYLERIWQGERFYLYLVRDGEVVFYIGQSHDPFGRLVSHVGNDWHHNPSDLGNLIHKNAPASHDWMVEFSTLAECEEVVQEQQQRLYLLPGQEYDIDDAECAMIWHHRPCLNIHENANPSPLPDKYKPLPPPVENPYVSSMLDGWLGVEE